MEGSNKRFMKKPKAKSKKKLLFTSDWKGKFTGKIESQNKPEKNKNKRKKIHDSNSPLTLKTGPLNYTVSSKTTQRNDYSIQGLQVDFGSEYPDITDLLSKLPEKTFEGFTPVKKKHSDVRIIKPSERSKRKISSTGKAQFIRKRAYQNNKNKCSVCGIVCTNKDSLCRHMIQHHANQRDTGVITGLQEELNLAVIDLASKFQGIISSKSKLPEKTFDGFTREDQIYSCIKYHRFYKNAIELKHNRGHNKLIKCTICGKIFNKGESLKQHRTYCQVKDFKCTDCDLKFRSIKSWEMHYSLHRRHAGSEKVHDSTHNINICGENLTNSHKVKSQQRRLVLRIRKLYEGKAVPPDLNVIIPNEDSKHNNSNDYDSTEAVDKYGYNLTDLQRIQFKQHQLVLRIPKLNNGDILPPDYKVMISDEVIEHNNSVQDLARNVQCLECGVECESDVADNVLLQDNRENESKHFPTSSLLCINCRKNYLDPSLEDDILKLFREIKCTDIEVKKEKIIPILQEELLKTSKEEEYTEIPTSSDLYESTPNLQEGLKAHREIECTNIPTPSHPYESIPILEKDELQDEFKVPPKIESSDIPTSSDPCESVSSLQKELSKGLQETECTPAPSDPYEARKKRKRKFICYWKSPFTTEIELQDKLPPKSKRILTPEGLQETECTPSPSDPYEGKNKRKRKFTRYWKSPCTMKTELQDKLPQKSKRILTRDSRGCFTSSKTRSQNKPKKRMKKKTRIRKKKTGFQNYNSIPSLEEEMQKLSLKAYRENESDYIHTSSDPCGSVPNLQKESFKTTPIMEHTEIYTQSGPYESITSMKGVIQEESLKAHQEIEGTGIPMPSNTYESTLNLQEKIQEEMLKTHQEIESADVSKPFGPCGSNTSLEKKMQDESIKTTPTVECTEIGTPSCPYESITSLQEEMQDKSFKSPQKIRSADILTPSDPYESTPSLQEKMQEESFKAPQKIESTNIPPSLDPCEYIQNLEKEMQLESFKVTPTIECSEICMRSNPYESSHNLQDKFFQAPQKIENADFPTTYDPYNFIPNSQKMREELFKAPKEYESTSVHTPSDSYESITSLEESFKGPQGFESADTPKSSDPYNSLNLQKEMQNELFEALKEIECTDIPTSSEPNAFMSSQEELPVFKAHHVKECADISAPFIDKPRSNYNTCSKCLITFKTLGALKRHICSYNMQNSVDLYHKPYGNVC